MKQQEKLQKQKSHAFGKDVFLLGEDKNGIKYWLESPSWDCGWYWGFGYIETYTNNNHPDLSKDIKSHQHADNFYSTWCNETLIKTTFSDDDKWVLCELFENFYTLRKLADAQHQNGKDGNFTSQRHGFDYTTLLNKNINRECLPMVMAKIINILGGDDVENLENKYKSMMED